MALKVATCCENQQGTVSKLKIHHIHYNVSRLAFDENEMEINDRSLHFKNVPVKRKCTQQSLNPHRHTE